MARTRTLQAVVIGVLALLLPLAAPAQATQPVPPLDPANPAPVPADAAVITPIPQVQDIVDQVSLERMMTYVYELTGETPALVGGQTVELDTRYTYNRDAILLAASYMTERLERLGLDVSYHWWTHSPQIIDSLPNVVAEKPGSDPGAGIFIIGAHLDDTSGSPSTLAPGADDNGSGSVALLTAAELLAPYTFDATIRFVFFTGEEQGLWGSQAYASSVNGQDLRGMLNMDMVAWDGQGGPDMDIHARATVPGSMDMAQTYADVIVAYNQNLTPVIYSNGITASDHSSFWNIGVAAILAIENYTADAGIPRDFNSYYHSVNDRAQYYNQPFYRAMVAASLATAAHLAGIRTDCYWADLDCDDLVGVSDVSIEASHWQASAGQWNYSLVYDVDESGVIDIVDVQAVAAQWGWTPPE